jgi:hypothetical protein
MEQNTAILKNIIQTLDELLVLDFWAIMDKRKPVHILDLDYSKDRVYTQEETDLLNTKWLSLYDTFYSVKNDGKSSRMLSDYRDELVIVSRIRRAVIVIDSLTWTFGHKDILSDEKYFELEHKALKSLHEQEPKFGINYMLPLNENIKKIRNAITGLENLYNRKRKHVEKKVEIEVKNVFDIVAKVGAVLEMQLNVKEMTVMEWLAWEKIAIDKQKSIEESKRKRTGKTKRHGK